eukprot:Plantae.Rhodophyta-Purpureofilum_apyrenoidigerum.ctg6719.p1 GENE.Plantae.Rhodophyta-Purpureofilum_apyrenoidigerum.ctg6719~~Plantae.Rhodophyta-Purpureofilum_apyrenoidigerum.ctg6719.p1  ORF type:complete len:324 (+),score=61.82 Plantae.Rhodophyta-Purpureofilum_apyrenoidigerum.ctg6719:245-1216(+)
MRPFVLGSHSRPVSVVKYNREGDLLFTSAKDWVPTVWRTNTGERLGTYRGHDGAVNGLDIYDDTSRLVTGSADNTAKLWDAEKGTVLYSWPFKCPVRAVDISPDGRHVALTTSMLMKQKPEVHLFRLEDDVNDITNKETSSLLGPEITITFALWTPMGDQIIGVSEDGTARKWDVETGKELVCVQEHGGQINDLQLSPDGIQFITASADKTAKLWDLEEMRVLKTYKTDRPVNAAAISPIMDHVLLGGGQEAINVALTSDREKFEARFYHKIYEEEFATVRGHFGPINAVAFSPDGKQFTTGGEESLVRMHNFDDEYFTRRYD